MYRPPDFIKKYLPYQKLELYSPLTADEATAKLESKIKPKSINPLRIVDGSFRGVIKSNEFIIEHDTPEQNVLYVGGILPKCMIDNEIRVPTIEGVIVNDGQGSRIKVTIRLNKMIELLCKYYIILLVILIITYPSFVPFLLLFWAFMVYPFYSEAQKAKKFLCDALEAKEI